MDKEKENKEKEDNDKRELNEKIEKAIMMAEVVKEDAIQKDVYFQRLKKYLDKKSKEKKEQLKICSWLIENPKEAERVIGEDVNYLWIVVEYMQGF